MTNETEQRQELSAPAVAEERSESAPAPAQVPSVPSQHAEPNNNAPATAPTATSSTIEALLLAKEMAEQYRSGAQDELIRGLARKGADMPEHRERTPERIEHRDRLDQTDQRIAARREAQSDDRHPAPAPAGLGWKDRAANFISGGIPGIALGIWALIAWILKTVFGFVTGAHSVRSKALRGLALLAIILIVGALLTGWAPLESIKKLGETNATTPIALPGTDLEASLGLGSLSKGTDGMIWPNPGTQEIEMDQWADAYAKEGFQFMGTNSGNARPITVAWIDAMNEIVENKSIWRNLTSDRVFGDAVTSAIPQQNLAAMQNGNEVILFGIDSGKIKAVLINTAEDAKINKKFLDPYEGLGMTRPEYTYKLNQSAPSNALPETTDNLTTGLNLTGAKNVLGSIADALGITDTNATGQNLTGQSFNATFGVDQPANLNATEIIDKSLAAKTAQETAGSFKRPERAGATLNVITPTDSTKKVGSFSRPNRDGESSSPASSSKSKSSGSFSRPNRN